MKNRIKVFAIVAAVVIGMVIYKENFDRKEKEKEAQEASAKKSKPSKKKERWDWN